MKKLLASMLGTLLLFSMAVAIGPDAPPPSPDAGPDAPPPSPYFAIGPDAPPPSPDSGPDAPPPSPYLV